MQDVLSQDQSGAEIASTCNTKSSAREEHTSGAYIELLGDPSEAHAIMLQCS